MGLARSSRSSLTVQDEDDLTTPFVSQEGSSDSRGNVFHPEKATLNMSSAAEDGVEPEAAYVAVKDEEDYQIPNLDGIWSEEDMTDDGCCFSARATNVHDDAEHNGIKMEDLGSDPGAESSPNVEEDDDNDSRRTSLASDRNNSAGSNQSPKADSYLNVDGERFPFTMNVLQALQARLAAEAQLREAIEQEEPRQLSGEEQEQEGVQLSEGDPLATSVPATPEQNNPSASILQNSGDEEIFFLTVLIAFIVQDGLVTVIHMVTDYISIP
jgi:hypothetical protein